VLMYAIAFALWWIFRGNDGEKAVVRKGRRRR
jgi:hypothetical protein